ncbi:MAG TPA: hypothetical protein VEB21_01695 [Terriglobales bacterium]|nr:hypothetical protein [Terriglobales bacterium]
MSAASARDAARVGLVLAGFSTAAVAIFGAAVLLTDTPQTWTALALALISLAAMLRSRGRGWRLWWWNCLAVTALWGVFDGAAALWLKHQQRPMVPVLARAQAILWVSTWFDPPIFGMRRPIPPHAGADASRCILFFGCSYTFGEGVGEEQTFPYLVQTATAGKLQTRNFGVSGTAPHYALAQVESGIVGREAGCHPTDAVYLLLPHHLVRVSGKWSILFGPRFVLDAAGKPVRNGTFRQPSLHFFWDIFRHTSMLAIAKRGYTPEGPVTESDFVLLRQLLLTLRQRLQEQYPGIRFEILYWDDHQDEHALELWQRLSGWQMPVQRLSDVLPGLHDPGSNLYLPDDRHPSPLAHAQLADYLVDRLSPSSAGAPPLRN